MKKIAILFVATLSFLGFYVSEHAVKFSLCNNTDYKCRDVYDGIERVLIFAPFFLVVAAIALLVKPKIFDIWWRFAWWGGPLTIGVIMLVNAGFHHTTGGFMNLSDMFDNDLTLLAYLFFVVGSLMQIWRGCKSK